MQMVFRISNFTLKRRRVNAARLDRLKSVWSELPILLISFVILFIIITNAMIIWVRLFLPYPIDAMEPGIVTDAWRMLQGDPIYTIGTDHATHLYGPLLTASLALVFRFTGPTFEVARFMSAISATAVVISLAVLFGNRDRLTFAIAVVLLLGVNGHSPYFFTEARPDMTSILFTSLALIVLYHGHRSTKAATRAALTATGSLLLMIAMMFKQTALAFIFVPILAVLLEYGRHGRFYFRTQLVLATVPISVAIAMIGAIWYLAPGLWHFIAEVPAQYSISMLKMISGVTWLLTGIPLFSLALIHWLYTDARNDLRSPRMRWLMATMTCAIPGSLVAYAKWGGGENSLMPTLFCFGAFCGWRASIVMQLLCDEKRVLFLRTVLGLLLSAFLFVYAYPARTLAGGPYQLKEISFGGIDVIAETRNNVIAETRLLRGHVVCPDDPTIPLMAKGYAGRSAQFERDAAGWRSNQAVGKEIQAADYVIVMRDDYTGWATQACKFCETEDNLLEAAGFTKSRFLTISSPVYELWRRTAQPGLSSTLSR